MTTTKTMMVAMQQIVEVHIKGRGPANKNPMRPSPTITNKVRILQGQNLYSQGNITRTDNVQSPQRTFGSRNTGGGPPGREPPGRMPRREPPGGDPLGGRPVGGGDPDNDDCQRDQVHTGKISSHIDIFDGDRTKAKKFQMEFGLARMTNPNH